MKKLIVLIVIAILLAIFATGNGQIIFNAIGWLFGLLWNLVIGVIIAAVVISFFRNYH